MTASEARRHDLYHGLEEVLGTDRADTLVAYLPVNEATRLATKDDLAGLRESSRPSGRSSGTSSGTFRTEIRGEFRTLRTEYRDDLRAVRDRLDRLFQTMAAGLIAVVGAMVPAFFVGGGTARSTSPVRCHPRCWHNGRC